MGYMSTKMCTKAFLVDPLSVCTRSKQREKGVQMSIHCCTVVLEETAIVNLPDTKANDS